MCDDENGNDDKPLQEMSESDRLAGLMDLMSRESISESKLRKILDYVEQVLSEVGKD